MLNIHLFFWIAFTMILIVHTLLIQYEQKVGQKPVRVFREIEHFQKCSGVGDESELPKTTKAASETFTSDMKKNLGDFLENISEKETEKSKEVNAYEVEQNVVEANDLHSVKEHDEHANDLQQHFSKQLDKYFEHTDLQKEFQKNDFSEIKKPHRNNEQTIKFWELEKTASDKANESVENGGELFNGIRGYDDFEDDFYGTV